MATRSLPQQTADSALAEALTTHPDIQALHLPVGFNWSPFVPLILAAFEALLKQLTGD